ncbi:MAG: ABC transporter permease [Deltaproteobacteria bacterium]|nr:ABC transporter permease [Deltaproteobacteria bacterium]
MTLGAQLGELVALRQPLPAVLGKALGLSAILLVFGAWFLMTAGAAEERVVSPTLLPSPLEVLSSIESLMADGALLPAIFATLRRVLSGFLLAVVIGVPFGMAAGSWKALAAFLSPLVLVARNIPIAALIPLTILWFGIDESQKVMFIFIATVPFVFSDAAAAVVSIHDRYVETAQTLGASAWQVVYKVLVPLALPGIFTSLRSLFGIAFGYIMLAELINAKYGLGYLLSMSQRRGHTDHIFLVLLMIGILAYGIDRALLFFQRGLFPYRKDI